MVSVSGTILKINTLVSGSMSTHNGMIQRHADQVCPQIEPKTPTEHADHGTLSDPKSAYIFHHKHDPILPSLPSDKNSLQLSSCMQPNL